MKKNVMYIFLGTVLLILFALYFRYEIIPTNENVGAYKIDRLTGNVYLLRGSRQIDTHSALNNPFQ